MSHRSERRRAPRTEGKRVVVIGAGIAGLTAAHELVERGFEVEVVEADYQPGPDADGVRWAPRIGGMARTQWAVAPVPPERAGRRQDLGGGRLRRLAPVRLPAPISLTLAGGEGLRSAMPDLRAFREAAEEAGLGPDAVVVTVERRPGADDGEMAAQVQQAYAPEEDDAVAVRQLESAEVPEGEARVTVSILHDQYPAEHGFRFFPSFYLHLFDTMKRTPLREGPAFTRDGAHRRDASRTTFDNLVTADSARFGLDAQTKGGRSFAVARRPAQTVSELFALTRGLLEDAGYDAKSVARLTARLIQYLTSSEERRQGELEEMTWEEFVRGRTGHTFDPRMQLHLVSAPQALAAMSARKNDARTIAYIGLQLILDQFRDSGYSDGTLNGPTSEAWLWHWEDYLRSHGVRFSAGRLAGFEAIGAADGPKVVRPIVLRRVGAPQADPRGEACWERAEPADYTVVTAPVDKVYEAIRRPDALDVPGVEPVDADVLLSLSAEHARANRGDDDVAKYVAFIEHVDGQDGTALDVLERERDAGPLRWMVGIQFFFEGDVRFIKGHTMCSDSPWGVSYISQAQYWTQKPRFYDGYRGVVSAIFTRFDAAGLNGKPARECTADEIARDVWKQIEVTLSEDERAVGEPAFYYIDENVRFDAEEGRVGGNATPYLVNHARDWDRRPGRRLPDGEYVYDVQVGGVVFAGVFARTHTRLTTMESANESARRAVNAILDAEGSRLQRCRTWRLEDALDIADLEPLREIDRRLYQKDGRHMMDNLLTEGLLRALPFDLARLAIPFDKRRPSS